MSGNTTVSNGTKDSIDYEIDIRFWGTTVFRTWIDVFEREAECIGTLDV